MSRRPSSTAPIHRATRPPDDRTSVSTFAENDAKLEVKNQGATISLDCTVTIRSDALQQDFVVWTKNGSVLDTQDGKSCVHTFFDRHIYTIAFRPLAEYSASKNKRDSSTVVHTLMIKEATAQDAGLYACKADNAPVMQQLVQISGKPFKYHQCTFAVDDGSAIQILSRPSIVE